MTETMTRATFDELLKALEPAKQLEALIYQARLCVVDENAGADELETQEVFEAQEELRGQLDALSELVASVRKALMDII